MRSRSIRSTRSESEWSCLCGYVAVSRGAHDAQLFTNDREKLPAALGHEVSRESAHTPQHKQGAVHPAVAAGDRAEART